MTNTQHWLGSARTAFLRAVFLLLLVALGALAGILILFRTGLYPGHYDHERLRGLATQRAVYLEQAAFAAILRNAVLNSLPEAYRFIDTSAFAGVNWKLDDRGLVRVDDIGQIEQAISWQFKLSPAPTVEDWPQLAVTLKGALSNAAEASGFFLDEVRLRDNGLIEVRARGSGRYSDLVVARPTPDGFIRDLLVWLGFRAPPSERPFPELWKR